MSSRSRVIGAALALILVVAVLAAADLLGGGSDSAGEEQPTGSVVTPVRPDPRTPAAPRSTTLDPETGLRWVNIDALPRQAQQTVALIERGGPFPYAKDGVVFGNRERLLPRQPSGYYREYTVTTPGSDDRGARRIVTGDQDRDFFYSADHYASFVRIRR